eukprot:368553_1
MMCLPPYSSYLIQSHQLSSNGHNIDHAFCLKHHASTDDQCHSVIDSNTHPKFNIRYLSVINGMVYYASLSLMDGNSSCVAIRLSYDTRFWGNVSLPLTYFYSWSKC